MSQLSGLIMRSTVGGTVDILYITVLIETRIARLSDQFQSLSACFLIAPFCAHMVQI